MQPSSEGFRAEMKGTSDSRSVSLVSLDSDHEKILRVGICFVDVAYTLWKTHFVNVSLLACSDDSVGFSKNLYSFRCVNQWEIMCTFLWILRDGKWKTRGRILDMFPSSLKLYDHH